MNAEMRSLYAQGYSLAYIARVMATTTTDIASTLRAMGVRLRGNDA